MSETILLLVVMAGGLALGGVIGLCLRLSFEFYRRTRK
jgi:hypothetical protein